MTLTLGQIASSYEAIIAVMALPLPAVTAYRVAKLGKQVMEEAAIFERERNACVMRRGTQVEGAHNYQVDAAGIEAFMAEIAELSAVEVMIDADPIKLSWLGTHEIAAKHLSALGPLLVDDTEAS